MKALQMATLGVLGVCATALIAGKAAVHATPAQGDGTTRVDVVFSGGHETDPRDGGRPVVLIASALGVPPEVFREAFTHVRPAPAGTRPDPAQVRRNKDALLQALRPYGVTNERLDEVSNYYRYNRSRGEMWPTTETIGYALFKRGKTEWLRRDTRWSGLQFAAECEHSRRKSELCCATHLQPGVRQERRGDESWDTSRNGTLKRGGKVLVRAFVRF